MYFGGTTPEDLRTWQSRFREILIGLLGILPQRADLCLEFQNETACGSFVRHRIRYQTEPGVYVPAYLLVPQDLHPDKPTPGLLCLHGHGHYGDTPEIFSLIAPRPMVLEIGLQDPLIPHDWAERGLKRIRRAYDAAGATDRLFVDRFDGGHHFRFQVAREVLERWRNSAF